LHRGLFRKGAKQTIVQTAHIILRIALVGVGMILVGTVLLIFDLVVGRVAAFVLAGLTLLVVIIIAVLPVIVRVNRPVQRKSSKKRTS
jgi:membrane-bound ClpP family serine protease